MNKPVDDDEDAAEFREPPTLHGLDFALTAVRQLDEAGDERAIRYAIVHLALGVELLLKARLFECDWREVFAKKAKASIAALKSGDFYSVGPDECIERLEAAGVAFEQAQLDALTDLRLARNRLVHFPGPANKDALKAIALRALSFLIEFTTGHTSGSAESAELLENLRAEMFELEEFVEARWQEIKPRLEAMRAPTVLECPLCRQNAGYADGGFHCLFCNMTLEGDDAIDRYLNDVLRLSAYEIVKDGGTWPRYQCPDCENYTFAPLDRDHNGFACFDCGVGYKRDEIEFCEECGRPYGVNDEDYMTICPDCFDYKVGKD